MKNKKFTRPALGGGVKFHTGRDLTNRTYPIFFIQVIPGVQPITTNWSPNDAEGIAMAILKQVELARRHFATPVLAETVPVPVSHAPPTG